MYNLIEIYVHFVFIDERLTIDTFLKAKTFLKRLLTFKVSHDKLGIVRRR